jgi:hypothetical protein
MQQTVEMQVLQQQRPSHCLNLLLHPWRRRARAQRGQRAKQALLLW